MKGDISDLFALDIIFVKSPLSLSWTFVDDIDILF